MVEHVALSTTSPPSRYSSSPQLRLFAAIRATDMWQRRNPREVELDDLVEPPTLRPGPHAMSDG
jgi:hypothetical protein